MSPSNKGGNGPTSSPMKVNHKSGTVGFFTHDPAHGTPSTSAPSYYDQHERWKQKLSKADFKALLWCVLMQYYQGKRTYKIEPELARKINCPPKLTNTDLRWLQRRKGYDFIAKQVHSNYLSTLIGK